MRQTSRDYGRPFRPRPVRYANALGELAARLGVPVPLHPRHLLAAARRAAGSADFGPDDFLEPLARLTGAIEREAGLTPVGRVVQRARLVGLLAARLRLQAHVARRPALTAQPVHGPVVIAGLQRTGTTLLHRLLAADPALRALRTWEALSPAPMAWPPPAGPDPRRRQARFAERALRYLAPDFFAVHPAEAEAPEEDVILLDLSLRSTVAEALLHVPSFSRWLEAQDQRPAYEILRLALQSLQYPGADRRWVLKTPHHLEWLDVLVEVFPDARIIQTHRDPKRTLPSFCSMVAHGRGICSDAVDPREIARHWGRKTRRMVDRAWQTRERLGDERFFDVHYPELVADPPGVLTRLAAWLGLPLSPRRQSAWEAAMRYNRPAKYGHHRYAMEDFGLTAAGIDALYADYRRRFGIADE